MDKKDFKAQYYNYLNNNLVIIQNFEKYRKKVLHNAIMKSFIYFILAVIVLYLLCMMILYAEFNPILFPVLLFSLYAFALKSITGIILADRQYRQKFNEEILPLIFYPVANFKQWPKEQNTDVIIDSLIFPNFDTREDNFCIFGYYKGLSITLSDTKLTLPVKAFGKPEIFKGTIIQIDFKKNIENHILLLSKNVYRNPRYKCYKTNISDMDDYLYTFVKENSGITFLNTNFWQIVKNTARAYSAKSFGFSYKNNTMLIAMNQRKAMPFGYLFKSLLKMKNYDEFIEKFIVIYELVDFINET